MKPRHPAWSTVLAIVFAGSLPSEVRALAPRYVSDAELARYPVIVVAKWERSPFTANHKFRDDDGQRVITRIEAYTKLTIIKVIKGKANLGTNDLMLGWGMAWSQDGWVSSGTSSEMAGDVRSVMETNIWFLTSAKSWDPKHKQEYLSVSNYREVQPLSLLDYFMAMGTSKPEASVPRLLASEDGVVVMRTLRYVLGGRLPWPHDNEFMSRYVTPEQPGPVLRGQSEGVKSVVERKGSGSVRAMAVAVYAELQGRAATQPLGLWLRDESLEVRGMAAGILSRLKDDASITQLTEAVKTIQDPWMACKIIGTLSDWGDVRLVPALIGFLQNGENAGYFGTDAITPSLKSKKALNKLTGFWFPFDVDLSMRAWRQVEAITDREARLRRLQELVSTDAFPLKAELVGDGTTNATFRVVNVSRQEVTITKLPAWGMQSWPAGSAGCGPSLRGATNISDFIKLKPGEAAQFATMLDASFLLAAPATRKLELVFEENGAKVGANAWIGVLEVSFGPLWKEERKIERVEETWPNGNLKAAGQTVNGKRFGEWNFFNEAGDRIRVIHYTGGRGSGEANPEHPDNKGAGKRPIKK